MPNKQINRDPFCEVKLSPVEHRGQRTDKTVVELLDEEGEFRTMPGVNAVHGEDYVLVPNRQVFDMVGDVLTRSGKTFKAVPEFGGGHSKARHWDGKRFSAKWYTEDIAEGLDGHAMALGVEAINSYDGSQPVGVRFFMMYCLCSNQFYLQNMMGNFIFRHVNREAGINLSDNVSDAMTVLRAQADRFSTVFPMFKQLRDRKVAGLEGFLKYRERANEGFWKSSRDVDVLDELHGNGITKAMNMGQCGAPIDSYWRILNAYTAVSTHKVGGMNGSSLSDRVTQFTMNEARIDQPALVA